MKAKISIVIPNKNLIINKIHDVYSWDCPLFPYRLGKRPRKSSAKQEYSQKQPVSPHKIAEKQIVQVRIIKNAHEKKEEELGDKHAT